jgi:hypothetical protein
MHTPDEPLDDMLRPTGQPASDTVWWTVYERTLPHLPRRISPWPGRILTLAVLFAGLTVGLWLGRKTAPIPEVGVLPMPTLLEEAETPLPPDPPTVPSDPEALEQLAHAGRPHLFRRAGDAYVADDRPLDALRCYREALNRGATPLEFDAKDTYLLMIMKQARETENHAWQP